MIAFLNGILAGMEENKVFLDVNGVGFEVWVPSRSLARIGANGDAVHLFTYLQVREDAMQLFGFLSREDLRIFKMLLAVSGIGPKNALSVLSVLTSDDLHFAVLSDDVKTISSVPGLGRKTAQKLILELKDKLKLEDVIDGLSEPQTAVQGDSDVKKEAIEALVALGYSPSEAMKSVRAVGDDALTVEEVLKQALRQIGA